MPRSVEPNGNLIRTLRQSKGLSQEALASAANLPVRTIQRAEQGVRLYLTTLARIAKALGVEPELLVAGGTVDLDLDGAAPLLLGREAELQLLADAWQDPSARVVSIVAWGGAGKTTLVKQWTNGLAANNWAGVDRVFGRTFGESCSAGRFLEDALRFFGDEHAAEGAAEARAGCLARLVAAWNTLLILDGLEALQSPPDASGRGQLLAPFQALLRQLLTQRRRGGLCVITTRWPLSGLDGYGPAAVRECELGGLSEPAGAELLYRAGAGRVGHAPIPAADAATNPELRAASRDYAGHPLSLQLLGSFCKAHKGDIQRRDLVRFERADHEPAFRVMDAYEGWLRGEESWSAALAILRLMGLFVGPADAGCLAALRRPPAIAGLTERLVDLDDTDWALAVAGARELGLLTTAEDAWSADDGLAAHRLVREYFAAQLAAHLPDAAREAHRRLYEYLKRVAPPQPNSLEEMAGVYRAMTHGCKAGLHDEVFRDLYVPLAVQDENRPFNLYRLGAFAEDLAALSSFFDDPYTKLSARLDAAYHSRVLLIAGFDLRALNRMDEAETTLRQSREAGRRTRDWKPAALAASSLGELHFVQGKLATAIGDVGAAIELADRSGHPFWRMVVRTTFGEILHHCGHRDAALAAFRDAEAMQADIWPERPQLHSWWGYRYCELLLDECESPYPCAADLPAANPDRPLEHGREVRDRARLALAWAKADNGPLDVGLALLTLGRTLLLDATAGDGPPAVLSEAEQFLDESVDYLDRSHERIWLPRGLLARAALWRVLAAATQKTSPDEHARYLGRHAEDLAAADERAARGSMAICRIEIALEKTRLQLDLGDLAGAGEALDRAEQLIDRTKLRYAPHKPDWVAWTPPAYASPYKPGELVGYARRGAEIARLRAAVAAR